MKQILIFLFCITSIVMYSQPLKELEPLKFKVYQIQDLNGSAHIQHKLKITLKTYVDTDEADDLADDINQSVEGDDANVDDDQDDNLDDTNDGFQPANLFKYDLRVRYKVHKKWKLYCGTQITQSKDLIYIGFIKQF